MVSLAQVFNSNTNNYSRIYLQKDSQKVYLSYSKDIGWEIRELNCLQRFLRFLFGAYSSTHLKHVMTQLHMDATRFQADPSVTPILTRLIPHMQSLWNKTYGKPEAVRNPLSPTPVAVSQQMQTPVPVNQRVQTVAKSALCMNCFEKPKCIENGRVHDYCSRTCAHIAINGQMAEKDFDPNQPPLFFYNNFNKNSLDEAKYYHFTNFADLPRPIQFAPPGIVQKLDFNCTEVAFQLSKFTPFSPGWQAINTIRDRSIRGLIGKNEPSAARQAFQVARDPQYSGDIFPDWHQGRKDKVMYDIVFAKFFQNIHLNALLQNTGRREIIEHTKNDNYWADGAEGSVKGTGENKLGRILMRVRNEMICTLT